MTDAVNIGLLVFHKQPDSEIQTAIRNFAFAYGLLGLMTALPTTPRFAEYEKVYLLKNPFIRQESMDTLAYLKLFFPFRIPDFKKHGMELLWNVSGEDREADDLPTEEDVAANQSQDEAEDGDTTEQ